MKESENPQLGRTVESLVAKMKSRRITHRPDYIYVASVSTSLWLSFILKKNIFQGGSLVSRTLAHFNIQDPAFWMSEAGVCVGWGDGLCHQRSRYQSSFRARRSRSLVGSFRILYAALGPCQHPPWLRFSLSLRAKPSQAGYEKGSSCP